MRDPKWDIPRFVDNKPVLYFDPNDCCFDLSCQTCGGRMWVSPEGHDLFEGMEVGLYWSDPEEIDPDKVSWGFHIAGKEDEYGWYVEPEGGVDYKQKKEVT